MPAIVKEVNEELLGGPVLVTIEYSVVAELESKFVKAMRQYARVRRRDGAYRWGIYRDMEVANRFVEIFLVHSWAEHLRQHERQTAAEFEKQKKTNVGKPGVIDPEDVRGSRRERLRSSREPSFGEHPAGSQMQPQVAIASRRGSQ